MPNVTLESSDGERFMVDVKVAELSGTIKTMLENLGVDVQEGQEDIIPLLKVRGDILQLVIMWADHHQDDPVVDEEETAKSNELITNIIPQWDQEFFNVNKDVLYDLILAANYLDIQALLDLGSQTVANMINGKTADEIRTIFNIRDDLSEAEKEQIRLENGWCSDK